MLLSDPTQAAVAVGSAVRSAPESLPAGAHFVPGQPPGPRRTRELRRSAPLSVNRTPEPGVDPRRYPPADTRPLVGSAPGAQGPGPPQNRKSLGVAERGAVLDG